MATTSTTDSKDLLTETPQRSPSPDFFAEDFENTDDVQVTSAVEIVAFSDAETRAVQRVLKSINSPSRTNYVDRYEVTFNKQLRCQEWTILGSNRPALMHFVARIDRRAGGCKLGPYGNQEFAKGKDVDALNKLKFIVALSDISDAPKELAKYAKYPEDTMSWFEMCLNEALNAGKSADTGAPNTHSFIREDSERGITYILAHTLPIVPDLPQRTTSSVGGGIRNSPSKQARKPIVLHTLPTNAKDLKLIHLFDPENRFTSWSSQAVDIAVRVPNFRDADGILISPRDYDKKLLDKQLVEVTGSFGMREIPPKKKHGISDNGSRAFNFMLQKLQVLPATTDYHAVLTGSAMSNAGESVPKMNSADVMDIVGLPVNVVGSVDVQSSNGDAVDTAKDSRSTTPQRNSIPSSAHTTPGLSVPLAAMGLNSGSKSSPIPEADEEDTISESEYEDSGSSPNKRKQIKQNGSTRNKNARVTRKRDAA
ncbi:hypothetical protein M422DRAFT_71734 [Sphaerobolus stellatus SS14]|uniref:Uncharacterized protein n=1 Tax=Sphaerobolus stellatus (strain SS14) TaxID=990650 RepID=A0A0C9TZ94_SPHS4|nr:hypothetical protein M422DRAFT_71734 [Sphaerobolus stellatus SS14]